MATIADTLNIATNPTTGSTNPVTFTYTVPAGTNQEEIIIGQYILSATQNGSSFTMVHNTGASNECNNVNVSNEYFGYLKNPTTGTLSMTKTGAFSTDFSVFTVNGVDTSASSPIDAYLCIYNGGTNPNISISTTTPTASDLLLDWAVSFTNGGSTHGAGQTEYVKANDSSCCTVHFGSFVQGSSTSNQLQAMSETWSVNAAIEFQIIAIKMAAAAGGTVVNPQTFFEW